MLLTLTSCGVEGVVDGKSAGVDMWACPLRPNNWALYIKSGNFPGDNSGVCVTEEVWLRYKVGDKYP